MRKRVSATLRTLILAVVLAVTLLPTPPASAAADCELAPPFTHLRDGLGAWIVGACVGEPTMDPDGSIHQETAQGTLSRFSGAPQAVFREPTRLWIDGPGGFGSEVTVVLPPSAAGERIETRRQAASLLDRAMLDESSMPMGWEVQSALTGRTGPSSDCQPGNDDLVLGRTQVMFGDERGRVRVIQGLGALRDGTGSEAMARIRRWVASCLDWQMTADGQVTTFKLAERPLQLLGEESVRYTVEAVGPAGTSSFSDTVVVRYGDLIVSHGFLLSARDQIKDGDLVGISELAERRLRAALRGQQRAGPGTEWIRATLRQQVCAR